MPSTSPIELRGIQGQEKDDKPQLHHLCTDPQLPPGSAGDGEPAVCTQMLRALDTEQVWGREASWPSA